MVGFGWCFGVKGQGSPAGSRAETPAVNGDKRFNHLAKFFR
jgi:hypothetical protein